MFKLLSKISNTALGIIITVIFCLFYLLQGGGDVELKSYDFRAKLFASDLETDRIAIVAIDSASIKKLGRWPWPRSRVAEVIEKVDSHGAKIIGLNILFTEPEEGTGLKAVRTLKEGFENSGLNNTKLGRAFYTTLNDYENNLDNDSKLRAAIQKSGKVVVPFSFEMSSTATWSNVEAKELPLYVTDSAVDLKFGEFDEEARSAPVAGSIIYPVETIGDVAYSMGHLNKFPSSDGIDRWEAILVKYGQSYYPSFALSVATSYLGIEKNKVTGDIVDGEGGISLRGEVLSLGSNLGTHVNYYNPDKSFPIYSFFDVYNDKISPAVFKNKIVLIGITDVGLGDSGPTPMVPLLSGVEREATIIENIISNKTISKPLWGSVATLGIILIFGILSTLLLVKLPARGGTISVGLLFVIYLVLVLFMFKSERVWVSLSAPTLLLVVNYCAITSRRFWFTEEAMESAVGENAESNKLLGMTFQGKGMLEMAYDKFKKIPIDGEMKSILYNLALELEKKRNYALAITVLERLGDSGYKDVGERSKRLHGALSGGAHTINLKGDSATIMTEGMEMPTLGRYEVLGELGRGAMGVVYKGQDPKINRVVAIKTVNFDEVEEKMIPELKSRFFREAQSAGTLNHPNIMTIYDAGEEGSLAYIAMELIDGRDLEAWTTKGKLLKPKDVLFVVAKIADALDYAHTNGVVHRDIKPANILITKKNEIKVADFGIARIQSASETKTGTVMGTPSYMSPEQVSGQKVDGRSDVFSLGVVLYEMLCGERPFKGDSIASLMYNITNGEPTPLAQYAPELPPFFDQLIGKAIDKDLTKRFQKASEFAGAIRWCVKKYEDQL